MALPYEPETAELRRINREKLQWAVSYLPRTSDLASFLADLAQHVLNLQMRLEDTLLLAAGIVADTTSIKQLEVMMHSLHASVPAVQELYGKIYMAATTDCSSVVEVTQVMKDVPGLTAAQVKSIRELHAKRTLLQKMKEESLGGLPQRQKVAVTVTAANALSGLSASMALKPAAHSSVSQPKVRFFFVKKPQCCGAAKGPRPPQFGVRNYGYCYKAKKKIYYSSISDLGSLVGL